MNKFEKITTQAAVLAIENIDTDQIIGSDYLKITNKAGLGKHLFADWRYTKDGQDNPDFVLNQEATKQAQVIIAGDNFACGSSREHAPWALLDYGIKAVISSSIADIFSSNAKKNGLLPIVVTPAEHEFLLKQNGKTITVDLENQTITCGDQTISFNIEPFARYCFLNGFDELDFLMSHETDIADFEAAR